MAPKPGNTHPSTSKPVLHKEQTWCTSNGKSPIDDDLMTIGHSLSNNKLMSKYKGDYQYYLTDGSTDGKSSKFITGDAIIPYHVTVQECKNVCRKNDKCTAIDYTPSKINPPDGECYIYVNPKPVKLVNTSGTWDSTLSRKCYIKPAKGSIWEY